MFFCVISLCSLHRKGYGVKNNLKKSAKIFGMCCFSLYIYYVIKNKENNLKIKIMKTYNEIKSAILNITSTVQPIETKMYDMVHSDGLIQTHQEHIYGEPISSITKAIWSGDFTMKEKLELNEALVSKMKI